jgi:hypothetical protein
MGPTADNGRDAGASGGGAAASRWLFRAGLLFANSDLIESTRRGNFVCATGWRRSTFDSQKYSAGALRSDFFMVKGQWCA